MLDDFLHYINANRLVRKNQRILLAVSGGIDSMVMAHLFIRAGFNTGIAHCNFSLRGKESDMDEALVKRFAARHKLPFFSARFDTLSYSQKNGLSVQVAARELRYGWFEEIRRKSGFDLVAVAHNLNDNIETMLINLTRGTGIAGLTGIKNSTDHIIRPLLFATRDSIEKYCRKNRISYREDRSNAETKYTRNKIRHLVIPVLKEINPSVEKTLTETAGRMHEVNEVIDLFIKELTGKSIIRGDGMVKVRLEALEPFAGNDTVLYELFKNYGVIGNNLGDLKSIMKGSTGLRIFTGSHRIIKNRNELLITEPFTSDFMDISAGNPEELRRVPVIKSVRLVKVTPETAIPADPATAFLDFEKVRFPVTIRRWRPGDFFFPLGMQKRKKLSDYLTDRKFSIPDKEKLLILESAGKIVWLIGEKIDNRFRITNKTTEALVIKAQKL